MVAEWRHISSSQSHRQSLRAQGRDPTSSVDANAVDPAITGAFASRFPLLLMHLSVPKPSESIDLNRSPDKRDILVGDEVAFRNGITTAAKEALQASIKKIEEKETEEWRAKHPIQDQQHVPYANGSNAIVEGRTGANDVVSAPTSSLIPPTPLIQTNGHASLSQPSIRSSFSKASTLPLPSPIRRDIIKLEDDDVMEVVPSSISSSIIPSLQHSSPSTKKTPVDFSTFAQPLARPQSFDHTPVSMQSNLTEPTPTRASLSPISPQRPPQNISSPSSSHSSPASKRARHSSSPTSQSSSQTHSPRQTQLSVIDSVNSSLSFAPRKIPMDDDILEQISSEFMSYDSQHRQQASLPKVQHLASLSRPGLNVLRLPPDEDDELLASSNPADPAFPTLCVLSTYRADELVMFHHLLSNYTIPSVPLDEAIPIDSSFPELSTADRDQLLSDVLEAERLQLEQRVPSGFITFQQAMQLCGFKLTAGQENSPLVLVAVPVDSDISIRDFLSTLRHIWSDDTFQRCHMLKMKLTSSPISSNTSFESASSSARPNTCWRVDGIRRAIKRQAAKVAKTRQLQYDRINPNQPTNEVTFTLKTVGRLREMLTNGLVEIGEAVDWTDLTCPHQQRIAFRITNQRQKSKQETQMN